MWNRDNDYCIRLWQGFNEIMWHSILVYHSCPINASFLIFHLVYFHPCQTAGKSKGQQRLCYLSKGGMVAERKVWNTGLGLSTYPSEKSEWRKWEEKATEVGWCQGKHPQLHSFSQLNLWIQSCLHKTERMTSINIYIQHHRIINRFYSQIPVNRRMTHFIIKNVLREKCYVNMSLIRLGTSQLSQDIKIIAGIKDA